MPKSSKKRLDLLVVERGLLPSRQAAQAAIMDGGVLVDGQKVTKPGTAVEADADLSLTKSWQGRKYVSRGGFKLEHAIQEFQIDVTGRVCLDVGASTGGFTDCLLQHGAKKVYAVDVGYGQIDWKLRSDERVCVIERANIRHLKKEQIYKNDDQLASVCAIDVSFICLAKVLPSTGNLLSEQAELIALVKPQFEAGRMSVGKGGVVRDPATHIEVLQNFIAESSKLNLQVEDVVFSPIKGPAGNIEFLAHLFKRHDYQTANQRQLDIGAIVKAAHQTLNKSE